MSPRRSRPADPEKLRQLHRDILQRTKEVLAFRQHLLDTQPNQWWPNTRMLVLEVRDLAIYAYLVHGRAADFRELIGRSAGIQLDLMHKRADLPRDQWNTSFNFLNYRNYLDACAARDFATAESIARITLAEGKLAEKGIGPFIRTFARAVFEALLSESSDEALRSLEARTARTDHRCEGYSRALRALYRIDPRGFEEALAEIARTHPIIAPLKSTPMPLDEHLCVTAIGIAQLARRRGLEFAFHDPLIPADLTS